MAASGITAKAADRIDDDGHGVPETLEGGEHPSDTPAATEADNGGDSSALSTTAETVPVRPTGLTQFFFFFFFFFFFPASTVLRRLSSPVPRHSRGAAVTLKDPVLEALPPEVFLFVLSFLPVGDLLSATMVRGGHTIVVRFTKYTSPPPSSCQHRGPSASLLVLPSGVTRLACPCL